MELLSQALTAAIIIAGFACVSLWCFLKAVDLYNDIKKDEKK